jgi:hypothetical protein
MREHRGRRHVCRGVWPTPKPNDNPIPSDQDGREYGPSRRTYAGAESVLQRIEAIYGKKGV